eukprot:jgi/Botrbrau1/14215/Bobra.0254s0005.1
MGHVKDDEFAAFMRLPVRVLLRILSQLGCRYVARAATTCRHLRALKKKLEEIPAFVSSLSCAETLVDAVGNAADQAMGRMPVTVGFAALFHTTCTAEEQFQGLVALKRKLPPRTPIIGCGGAFIMGMDTAAVPKGVEVEYQGDNFPRTVSLLLGHIPDCRAHIFAAEDPPFQMEEESSGQLEDVEAFREWMRMKSGPVGGTAEEPLGKPVPKIMIIFCRSNAVESFALTARMMDTANVAYPGIVVTGGVVSNRHALLYDDGGEVSALADTVSYAGRDPRQAPARGSSSTRKWYRARWVGLVISDLKTESSRSPEAGPSGARSCEPSDALSHPVAPPPHDCNGVSDEPSLDLNTRFMADSVAVWGLGPVSPHVWEGLEVRIDYENEGAIEPGCQRLLIQNCSGGIAGLLQHLRNLGPLHAPWAAVWPRQQGSSAGDTYISQLESGGPLAIGWIAGPDELSEGNTLQLWIRVREVNGLGKVLEAANSGTGVSICCQLLHIKREETLKLLSFVRTTLQERHPPLRLLHPWPPPSSTTTVVGTSALLMMCCSNRGRTAFGEASFEVGNLVKGAPEVPLVGIACDGEFGPDTPWGTVGFSFHEPGCPGPACVDDGRLCHSGGHKPSGALGHSGCGLQAFTLSIAALSSSTEPP